MKKALVLCVVTFLLLVGISFYFEYMPSTRSEAAPSASTTSGDSTVDAVTARSEIAKTLDEYYRIARTNDSQTLAAFSRRISSPDYSYSSELGLMDKSQTLKLIESSNRHLIRSGYEGLEVRSFGDTAVVKYLDTSLFREGDGLPRLQNVRFSSTWVRTDRGWEIVSEHSSVIPAAKHIGRRL